MQNDLGFGGGKRGWGAKERKGETRGKKIRGGANNKGRGEEVRETGIEWRDEKPTSISHKTLGWVMTIYM